MFCQSCGKQIEDGSRFCPYCGAANGSEKEQKESSVKKGKSRKKKKAPVIIIAIAVLVVLGVLIFSDNDASSEKEQLIALIQNGYLGNYDTVTIKEVLESMDENAEWNAGEAVSEEHYIVEYKGNNITVQFSVNGLEEEAFKVSGIDIAGMGSADMEAYDVKIYLDGIYQLYADSHPEKGLYIDTSTSNNTLKGHVGPVRTEAEFSDKSSEKEASLKDLSEYENDTKDVEDNTEEKKHSEGEEQLEEENRNLVTGPLTYGTYSYDGQTGIVSTAYVGFYTDEEGGDYIYIECWENDREIACFEGILEENEENFYAYCEEINTGITVTFADSGLYVEIADSDFPDIDKIAGFYSLTDALNLNEVG